MKHFILLIIIIFDFFLLSCDLDWNMDANVTYPVITSIRPDSAKIADSITITGTGFDFFQGSSYVTFNTIQSKLSDTKSWSDTVIKLYVPAGATSGKVFVTVVNQKSNEMDFTVNPNIIIEDGTIRDIDGNTYKTVKIGIQLWMKENLNVSHYRNGDPIPEVKNPTEWINLTTGAWCYYINDSAMGPRYGKLYNWYAVNDPRGLAPTDWHVPSHAEWISLTTYLGGEDVAGGKMKEAGTSHWQSPNAGATNSSGFTALPGGYRLSNGAYNGIGGCRILVVFFGGLSYLRMEQMPGQRLRQYPQAPQR